MFLVIWTPEWTHYRIDRRHPSPAAIELAVTPPDAECVDELGPIRVKDVLDLLAAGVPEPEILEDYDFLQLEDIRACLESAAQQVNYPVLVNV